MKKGFLKFLPLAAVLLVTSWSSFEDGNKETKAGNNTDTHTVAVVPENCIPGIFSVSNDKKVYFSKGNLQCNVKPKPGESLWRFAEHQYDKCFPNGDKDYGDNYTKYKGKYIDIFGWGTWLNGSDVESPTATVSGDEENYYIWSGTSAIGSEWETLTYAEWDYLLNGRNSAKNKCGRGTVAGVDGTILLPDDWTYPNNLSSKSTPAVSFKSFRYDWSNTYTAEDWAKMEANGAVFLPFAGYRSIVESGYVYYSNSIGRYWSSTTVVYDDDKENDYNAYAVHFEKGDPDMTGVGIGFHEYDKGDGNSVRLVRPL
jgi:hypothetical protein